MSTTIKRIGFIGAGVMGEPMAGHLLDAGFDVAVHTRTRAKAKGLLDRGATWADSPAAAADGAGAAISIVSVPDDVEEVHLGPRGTLAAGRLPRLIIDMTTSRPQLAARIAGAARGKGAASIDAPVSGGDVGARNATLSIMVGGESGDVEVAMPILRVLGKQIVHHGPAGAGQHAKMVNQVVIATAMIGVCEGMLYARKAGLDPMKVIESVSGGAAGSWTISNLAPRMVRRDFRPGFYVEHFIKDLGIAMDEAAQMGLNLPGLELAKRLYDTVQAQGHGRRGSHALLLALERMNDVECGALQDA